MPTQLLGGGSLSLEVLRSCGDVGMWAVGSGHWAWWGGLRLGVGISGLLSIRAGLMTV